MPLRKKIDKNRIILLKNIYKIKNPNQFFIFLQKVYHTEKFLTIFALPCRPCPSIAPAKPAPLRVAMSDLPLPLHSATRGCPKIGQPLVAERLRRVSQRSRKHSPQKPPEAYKKSPSAKAKGLTAFIYEKNYCTTDQTPAPAFSGISVGKSAAASGV